MTLVAGLLVMGVAGAAQAEQPEDTGNLGKVFVCKYVGTPGDDERLQTGDNPISVSVHAIKDFAGVGSWFNDAQGRSFVLALDTRVRPNDPEPDVSACPDPDDPITLPATPGVDDPCGPGNAAWIVPGNTASVTWALDQNGHLIATAVGALFTTGSATHDFGLPQETITTPCPTVTAVNPDVDLSGACDVEGTYTIPDTEGVQYLLDGEEIDPGVYDGPASGELTAVASGAIPLGNPGFSFALDVPAAADCPDIAGAEAPDVDQSALCDVDGTFTIPDTVGVQYLLDGEEIAPDTYEGPISGTVTAVGVGDTVLEDPEWEYALLVEEAEVCEVFGEESERPTPKPDDEPTVKGVAEEVPTAVDAGLGGLGAPVGPVAAPGSLLGQGLVGGGLMLLLFAGWLQRGRLSRGAHQF